MRVWASAKLKSQILSWAHALNLQVGGFCVNKYADIDGKSWEKDGGNTNAKKMYKIFFGDFEGANVSWSYAWECEYLMEHGRSYVVEHDKEVDK